MSVSKKRLAYLSLVVSELRKKKKKLLEMYKDAESTQILNLEFSKLPRCSSLGVDVNKNVQIYGPSKRVC